MNKGRKLLVTEKEMRDVLKSHNPKGDIKDIINESDRTVAYSVTAGSIGEYIEENNTDMISGYIQTVNMFSDYAEKDFSYTACCIDDELSKTEKPKEKYKFHRTNENSIENTEVLVEVENKTSEDENGFTPVYNVKHSDPHVTVHVVDHNEKYHASKMFSEVEEIEKIRLRMAEIVADENYSDFDIKTLSDELEKDK